MSRTKLRSYFGQVVTERSTVKNSMIPTLLKILDNTAVLHEKPAVQHHKPAGLKWRHKRGGAVKYFSHISSEAQNNFSFFCSKPSLNMACGEKVGHYTAKAGTENWITAHSFRHTFAANLLGNGAGIRHVQEILGHESLETTQI